MLKTLKDTLENTVRAPWRYSAKVNGGIFLRDFTLDFVSILTGANFRNKQGISKDEFDRHDAFREILRLSDKELYYLVDPKFIWTGYFIPNANTSLPETRGNLISCRKMLIPYDDGFKGHKGITLLPDIDYVAVFHLDEEIKLRRDTFEIFVNSLEEIYPEQYNYKRDCMRQFYRWYKAAIPYKEEGNLIKSKIRAKGSDWVFHTKGNTIIRALYKTHAKRRMRNVTI